LGGSLIALVRSLPHQPAHYRSNLRGYIRANLVHSLGFLAQVPHELLDLGAAWERNLAAQKLVEGAAETVQVRPRVRGSGVHGLLGRQVVRRPEHSSRPR